MGIGMIRRDETDKVPISKPIWFLVLTQDLKTNTLIEEVFQTSKTDIKLLETRLETQPNPIKIYAIWTGNWNTDLFDMEKSILLKRLKEEIETWKKPKYLSK